MKTSLSKWTPETGWITAGLPPENPRLILYFGDPKALSSDHPPVLDWIHRYPDATVCGCSTAGEILGAQACDHSVAAALIGFDSTEILAASEPIAESDNSLDVGLRLARQLNRPGLRHILLISDGLHINGTTLVDGIRQIVGSDIPVSGGLAGDGDRFQSTLVGIGHTIRPRQVVGIGLFGQNLHTSCGSRGGWHPFGPHRLITKSSGNTLYELDGRPALALYKRYLGEMADNLPATGLLFPLGITNDPSDNQVIVRTILAVDETTQSLTFAGDIPQGACARLMKASSDELIAGAANAADDARQSSPSHPSLAILVSCVGRRLVLGQRTDEELETVRDQLPPDTPVIGFYSYGETCPAISTGISELHNQTMTITLLGESP
ncbi:MAG: FIST signal transduction protein [Verrucomicrobiales bacterium]|nr:FIST C-terminal domain-containing protein [Verrucomicrobiota bacterium JB025]